MRVMCPVCKKEWDWAPRIRYDCGIGTIFFKPQPPTKLGRSTCAPCSRPADGHSQNFGLPCERYKKADAKIYEQSCEDRYGDD